MTDLEKEIRNLIFDLIDNEELKNEYKQSNRIHSRLAK